jgi:hypothetical protein
MNQARGFGKPSNQVGAQGENKQSAGRRSRHGAATQALQEGSNNVSREQVVPETFVQQTEEASSVLDEEELWRQNAIQLFVEGRVLESMLSHEQEETVESKNGNDTAVLIGRHEKVREKEWTIDVGKDLIRQEQECLLEAPFRQRQTQDCVPGLGQAATMASESLEGVLSTGFYLWFLGRWLRDSGICLFVIGTRAVLVIVIAISTIVFVVRGTFGCIVFVRSDSVSRREQVRTVFQLIFACDNWYKAEKLEQELVFGVSCIRIPKTRLLVDGFGVRRDCRQKVVLDIMMLKNLGQQIR